MNNLSESQACPNAGFLYARVLDLGKIRGSMLPIGFSPLVKYLKEESQNASFQ